MWAMPGMLLRVRHDEDKSSHHLQWATRFCDSRRIHRWLLWGAAAGGGGGGGGVAAAGTLLASPLPYGGALLLQWEI